MTYKIIPTALFIQAVKDGIRQAGNPAFEKRGSPGECHRIAQKHKLTRKYYHVVAVPQPVVMSDLDPRLN